MVKKKIFLQKRKCVLSSRHVGETDKSLERGKEGQKDNYCITYDMCHLLVSMLS
jgi:hypothetical protein